MNEAPLNPRAQQHAEAAERLIRGALEHPNAASGLLRCAALHVRKARHLARSFTE